MKDTITTLTQQFRAEHKAARRSTALLLALALTVTLFVNWQLHGVGIAKTTDYQCGEVEHEHTAECYQKVLVCGYEEGQPEDPTAAALPEDDAGFDAAFGVDDDGNYGISTESSSAAVEEPEYIYVPHEHTEDCYQEVQVLTCTEEEHEHTDDCFDPEDNSLICDIIPHTHDDSCYTTERELVCGLEEGELVEEPNPDYVDPDEAAYTVFDNAVTTLPSVTPQPVAVSGSDSTPDVPVHHHTEACYGEELVCGLPEHHHTVNCLADPQADVESEDEWLAKTNVTLTGMWPEDLVTVAQSQLGYEQSERNFELDAADGVTVRHYTRYGQWYGNPYGEWDVMFLSFCLNYAGVPQSVVPQTAGVMALHSQLRDSAWLQDTDGSTALPGDIVLYNTLTTETVAVETEPLQAEDASTEDGMGRSAVSTGQTEPETEERTISTETVGIVTDVPEDGQTLTVISGNVDGRVAEVTLSAADVTSVIRLTEAYAQQTEEEEKPEEQPGDAAESIPEEDDAFSVHVDWVEEGAETTRDSAALYARSTGEVGLEQYIKSVIFSKKGKSDWEPIQPGDTFADGESVQIKLSYEMPQGIISAQQNKLTYQLPNGLTLKTAKKDGVINQGKNKVVGSYTISTDGKVEMTFTDPSILSGAAFDGNFTFEASVDYRAAGEDGKVSFNDQFSLTIRKPDADISVEKSLNSTYGGGKANYQGTDGNYYIDWYVKAATKNGTDGQTVRIGDLLNGDSSGSFVESGKAQVLGSYVEDSVRVFKLPAGKTAAADAVPVDPSQYTLTISNDGTLQRSLLVEDLPALEAGESYLLCYTTKVTVDEMNKCTDRDGRIYNKGCAGIKNQPDVVTDKAAYISFNKRLSKDGKLKDDGTIEWTITLNAPHTACKTFLRGYTVKDLFPAGVDVIGDVTVRADGKQVGTITAEELKNGYQIPSDSNATTYTFTFTTTSPNTNGTLTNTATAAKGDAEFTASKEFQFGSGSWSIKKTHVTTSNNVATWSLVATNDLGGTDFRLVDVMDALGENGKRLDDDAASGARHWFYKAELEEDVADSLELTLRDGSKKTYSEVAGNVTIQCYSDYAAKNLVTDDNTTKARAFIITVNGLAVRRMELSVRSHEDREDVETGETRKYQNAAYLNSTSVISKATDSYTRYDAFEKMVSTDDRSTYSKQSTVQYQNVKDKRLRYRITLSTDADETKDIVITDTLPPNTEYKKDKTSLYLDGKEISSKDGRWTAACDTGSNLLTLRLTGYNPDGQSHSVEIRYEVDISKDPKWDDLSVSEVSYPNTAVWEEESSSTNTTVIRDVTEVKKTGEQLKDLQGRPTNRVRYTVYINPAAKRLNGGASLTVEDRLKLVSGADAYGDLSTVKFYHYEFSNGEPGIGDELPEGMCIVLPATSESWLRAEIPDATAIVIQYECEIDPGTSTKPELSNEVWLNGVKKGSAENKVEHDSSSSSVSMGQLLLNKSDSYTGALLPGAKFAMDAYDPEKGKWEQKREETTNESGQILLGVTPSGSYNSLRTDTLYRIRETEAPAHYEKDSKPKYVLFVSDGEDFGSAYQKATGISGDLTVDGVTIAKDSIIQGNDSTTTVMDVPNTYNRLTVIKSWLDSETKRETSAPVDEIRVQLYRTAKDGSNKTAVGDPVALNAANGWSYTWEGNEMIPSQIDGVACYYHVEEVTSGNWTLVAANNDGVQTGKIYLFNYVYAGYELPSTGGEGTAPFAAAGGALMAAALIGGAVLSRKKRKEH